MKLPAQDVLDVILTDLVADQIIRALELGYKKNDVEDAVRIALDHGLHEYSERQRIMYGKGKGLQRS